MKKRLKLNLIFRKGPTKSRSERFELADITVDEYWWKNFLANLEAAAILKAILSKS